MSSIADVKNELGITAHTWNNYIKEGVIVKQKKDAYEVGVVAQQIIRDRNARINKSKGDKTRFLSKIKKLEDKMHLLAEENGDPDLKKYSRKELLDFEIAEEKLVKMRHDNKVRKKEYMPVELFGEFVTGIASEFAGMLDPIVTNLKQKIPDMSSRLFDELKKDVARKRNKLADHIEGKTVNELLRKFNPDSCIESDDPTENT